MPTGIQTVHERSSDHNPIFFQLGRNEEVDEDNQQQEQTQKINLYKFKKKLDSNLRPVRIIGGTVEIESTIDDMEENVSTTIQQIAREVTKARFSKYGDLPHEIKAQQKTGLEEQNNGQEIQETEKLPT